ncbi:hypothetical protein Hanom_Chr00s000390g01641671 [Helianthus anomalus]
MVVLFRFSKKCSRFDLYLVLVWVRFTRGSDLMVWLLGLRYGSGLGFVSGQIQFRVKPSQHD